MRALAQAPWLVVMVAACARAMGPCAETSGPARAQTAGPALTETTDTSQVGSTAARPAISVCRFAHPGELGPRDAAGQVSVPPNHPALAFMGRVACTPEAVTFAFPGASLRFRFRGSELQFVYRDHGDGSATGTNFFTVVVDHGAPEVLALKPGEHAYPIVHGDSDAEHSVEIFKRTESAQWGRAGSGRGEFLGLRISGAAELLPVPARRHRIEFIGDSITCGYGTEAVTNEPDGVHYTSRNSNAYASWAAVTARTFDADLMLVAYSGRGIYRNYQGSAGEPLPAIYPRTLPDDPAGPSWDFSSFDPEVVVVNLGTNDFSPGGVDRSKFRDGYLRFLAQLRGHYPKATIVLAVGPMMSDYYPPGEKAWSNIQADIVSIRSARRDAGDDNVAVLIIPTQTGPFGEDWHPTQSEQADMATRAVELIRSLRGW